jgi:hypothetical protein
MRALTVVGFSGNPTKCKFAQKEVVFLGHRITNGKMFALHDKVKTMLEYTKPATLTELRAFLGLMSYYRRYIQNFSFIAAPLAELTGQSRIGKSRKTIKLEANAPWPEGVWTQVHDDAFEALKGALLRRPVLTLPLPDACGRLWRLATDASKVAMGAVLSQIDERGEEHPVAYYSRKLQGAEIRWDIWELELAAIVWATSICRHYLRGVRFELITDSKVVAGLLTKDVPSRRANWVLRLSEFDFELHHRIGEKNRNADFMSRWAAMAKETYNEWQRETTLRKGVESVARVTQASQDEILVVHHTIDPAGNRIYPVHQKWIRWR